MENQRDQFCLETKTNTQKHDFHKYIQDGNLQKVIEIHEQCQILPNEEISIKGEFWTALHYACHFDKPEILKYLLNLAYKQYGKQQYPMLMALGTKDGWTPYMISCIYNKPSTLEVLIKAGGIQLQQKDKNGRTGEDLSKFYGAIDVYEVIYNYKKKGIENYIEVNEECLNQYSIIEGDALSEEMQAKLTLQPKGKANINQLLITGIRKPCIICQSNLGYIKYTKCCDQPIHLICSQDALNMPCQGTGCQKICEGYKDTFENPSNAYKSFQ